MRWPLTATGNAYITGDTDYPSFPTTAGVLNSGTPGPQASQVFLSEFSPAGGLMFNALLGDPDPQNGGGGPIGSSVLAVDQSGDVYVAGETGTLWPTTSGAYLRQIPGSMPYATPFVMEVAPGGGSITYSTYLDYANQVSRHRCTPRWKCICGRQRRRCYLPDHAERLPAPLQHPRQLFSDGVERHRDGSGLLDPAWRFNLLPEFPGAGPKWGSVGCRGDQERELSFSESAGLHLSGFFCVSLGLYS